MTTTVMFVRWELGERGGVIYTSPTRERNECVQAVIWVLFQCFRDGWLAGYIPLVVWEVDPPKLYSN